MNLTAWLSPRLLTHAGIALLAGAALAATMANGPVLAEDAAAAPAPPPDLSEAVLTDPHNIEIGKAIWDEQCTHCHGAKAYPGKAPKLKPARYKPDFVYHRVSKGFRGMPPWEELYSQEEIVGVVAYVKSKQFSP